MGKIWIVSVALLGFVLAAGAGDWTQWRGSNRDLIVPDEKVLPVWPEGGPQRLWQVELPGEGYSEPAVVGGTIYITGSEGDKSSRKGMLYALEVKDGRIRWQSGYGPEWGANFEFARTSPTVVDGRVYVMSGLGAMVCLDAATGKGLWRVDTHEVYGGRNITWGIAENPLVYDGKVVCQPGGADASVVALDAKTGALVWRSRGLSERSAYCSAALLTLNGKRQVVTMLENHVVGVDAQNGALLWKHPHRNKYAVHPNTPVLCGKDRIFISSGYGYGSEILEIAGGAVTVVWSDKRSDNHFQGIAFYQKRVFSSGGGRLSCFDPSDGRQVYTVDGVKKASFCMTPSGMITYDVFGGQVSLVQIAPDAAKVVSSFKVGYGNGEHWSSPVVANGVLYLRRGKGLAAYAIGMK